MIGVVTAIVALSAATVIGILWRRTNGVLRPVPRPVPRPDVAARGAAPGSHPAPDPAHDAAGDPDADLGPEFGPQLGERATLVQFSSAFCAPCRATRRVLTEVAAMVDGVTYIEVDAESRLDLVRRLGVLRTPTILVLDGVGRVVRRGSGQPRKADVIAALGDAILEPAATPSPEQSPEPSPEPSPESAGGRPGANLGARDKSDSERSGA